MNKTSFLLVGSLIIFASCGAQETKEADAATDAPVEAAKVEQELTPELKNMIAGQEFLLENAKREGVVSLPSGLQYEVMVEGKGSSPALTDQVTTHYAGTLIDGTPFDSSVERGTPATFPVNGVIPGWIEALQLMKVGSKWKLFIPSNLAYGPRAMGPVIKANSTLVFEVELLKIN